MPIHPDTLIHRKARGAFFTPPAIADYLAAWAVGNDPHARILDPTCGEAVFLLAAGRRLRHVGAPTAQLDRQIFGVDLHQASLDAAMDLLEAEALDAHLLAGDFFDVPPPTQLGCPLPEVDAVIGNPPFIRFHRHVGRSRERSRAAALAQGVGLSGLASSWAALLVHACSFLKPDGRLAMVLPAELLTVHYAEPVRQWLRRRFTAVHLVMFERLQFSDALEKVVLVVAHGAGGTGEAFALHYVADAEDLPELHPFGGYPVTPAGEGKWTDLLLPPGRRELFRRVATEHFTPLESYGRPELGTVTGANDYFTLDEPTRQAFGLSHDVVAPISPPGTRHLRGLSFTIGDWNKLLDAGERVWLLQPPCHDDAALPRGLRTYLAHGKEQGVPTAYKCQVRSPWWRPPMVASPDLFFTYMSHRYPRLVANTAKTSFVNSMHGIRLRNDAPSTARSALPLLTLNSVTMLGAEIHGRSYGGGVLKMEPREAAKLPVPNARALEEAWRRIAPERQALDRQLRSGRWTAVAKRVDEILLREALGLSDEIVRELHGAALTLRERRIGRERLDG